MYIYITYIYIFMYVSCAYIIHIWYIIYIYINVQLIFISIRRKIRNVQAITHEGRFRAKSQVYCCHSTNHNCKGRENVFEIPLSSLSRILIVMELSSKKYFPILYSVQWFSDLDRNLNTSKEKKIKISYWSPSSLWGIYNGSFQ